ncbi:unnamed protein product, partial [Ilex paraguariensis]
PIGKVLAYDQTKLSLARPGVARVCVEVNLLSNNPSRIWLDMRDEGARWQKIIYEKSKKYYKSCRKKVHGEDDCRRRKVTDLEVDDKGKNPLRTDTQTEKVTNDKGKRKQSEQAGNPTMQTKERGSGFRKDKDNLRQPNLTAKNKGVWIQQNKGGELKDFTTKNGSCNTKINEGRPLEVGKEDMPDKGEHSGKDNVDHNGEDFLPKESSRKLLRRYWVPVHMRF